MSFSPSVSVCAEGRAGCVRQNRITCCMHWSMPSSTNILPFWNSWGNDWKPCSMQWWTILSPKRKQELALGGAGVGVAVLGVGIGLLVRRLVRRARAARR